LLPAGASAGDDDAIRAAFEGKLVVVRIAMPASTTGVDVYPTRPFPVDTVELNRAISSNGIGVQSGQSVVVTRVKAKKKHIEFQFGQGGKSQEPTYSSPSVPRSRTEKRLRDELEDAKDADERERLKDEIEDLEDERHREEKRLERLAKLEHETRLSRHSPEEWALMAGSRFNVRFHDEVPADALTPEGLRRILEEYVDFDRPPGAQWDEPMDEVSTELTKGMSVEDVEAAYGAPASCHESDSGDISVRTCSYRGGDSVLEAKYVDGILIKYTLSSQ
jgi:hypothetical protein